MPDIVVAPPLVGSPDLVAKKDQQEVELWAVAPLVSGPDLVAYGRREVGSIVATPPGYRLPAAGAVFNLGIVDTPLTSSSLDYVLGSALKRDYAGDATASQWTDRTGVGHAVQGTTLRQPSPTTTPAGNTAVDFLVDSDGGGAGDEVDRYSAAAAGASVTFTKNLLFFAIKTTQVTADFAIFYSIGDSNRFYCYLTPDGLLHVDSFNDTSASVSNAAINDGEWYRCMAVIDDTGSAVRLYVNGTLQTTAGAGSGVNNINLGALAIRIGDNLNTGAFPFVGTLARVGIAQSNTAFTAGQLAGVDAALASWIEVGAAAYSLVSDSGTFVETGTAVGLLAQRKVAADSGTFAHTGTAANLAHGYAFTAASGTFAETGTAAGLLAQRKVTADAGAFTHTGTAASLERGYFVAAASGSFTLTGTAANFAIGKGIPAASGTFTLTGTAAGLLAARKTVADSGTFAHTGTAATLRTTRTLTSASGTFALTGQAANFAVAMPAASGTFVHTGTAAGLLAQRRLTAASGSFALTGQDATLTGPSASATLAANSGTFVHTGTAAVLRAARTLVAASGSFAHTGTAASLERGYFVTAASGVFTHTGTAAGLLAGRKVAANAGSYTLTGQPAGSAITRRLIAGAGAFALTGVNANLAWARRFAAASGTFVFTGNDADLTPGVVTAAFAPEAYGSGFAVPVAVEQNQMSVGSVTFPTATTTVNNPTGGGALPHNDARVA